MAKNRSVDGVITPKVGPDELEKALELARQEAGEQVRLVAITMKECSKIQVPVARGFEFVEVGPLGLSPPVPKEWAMTMVADRVVRSRNVRPALIWHIAPPPRPKNAQRKFFERDGRKFFTDIYAPSEDLLINGRQIYHSISQSIFFIARVLRTAPGIQRWITDFDTRPEVAMYGNYVIQSREAEEREMLGVSQNRATVIV